jgi:hypothetical protein
VQLAEKKAYFKCSSVNFNLYSEDLQTIGDAFAVQSYAGWNSFFMILGYAWQIWRDYVEAKKSS